MRKIFAIEGPTYRKLLNHKKVWEVVIGSTTVQGKTKEEALANAETYMQRLVMYGNVIHYRFATDGTAFVLTHDGSGWRYDIVYMTNPTSPVVCLMGGDYTEQVALETMERHVAQFNN